MNLSPAKWRSSIAGGTLVETLIAAGVLAVGLAGICMTNWKTLHVLLEQKQEAAATFCLSQRVEQLRHSGWSNVTSGTYIQTLLNTQPGGATDIPGFAEEVSVNSYPTASGTSIDVTESSPGAAVVNTNNTSFAAEMSGSMVKVDINVTWPNFTGPTHERTVTTIISNGGIQ